MGVRYTHRMPSFDQDLVLKPMVTWEPPTVKYLLEIDQFAKWKHTMLTM